mgnify:CR=1 FL=1
MTGILKNHQDIIVVSAPSGTGKTTMNRRLIKEAPSIEIAISHTTRIPRSGEIDGTHYHFIKEDQFLSMAKNHEFLEWANVHGKYYGTSKAELERIQGLNHHPLLEIDVQGWAHASKHIPDAKSIFILPPSMKSLWERLEGRGSDNLQTRWLRFQNAFEEISSACNYSHFIINNDFETAFQQFKSLILDQQDTSINPKNGVNLCKKLQDEFKNAEWVRGLKDGFESGK